jgi:WD40 repeat protein
MSQFFISYSRKDLDIAEKIINALAKDDFEPWIDWKSIPKGEKFETEIQQGIEGAEVFLFLLSPNSAESEWCNKEIDHAVKNGKRILPIVIRDADLKIIHPEISKRNWIFCRDGQDDFKRAIEEIRKTVHIDYEWLKFHTELQVKALKWEQKKDTSRLLRGKELREAEEKLAGTASLKDPQPTNLQRQYVLVGRKDEERRRIRVITITLIAGIIIIVLGTYAQFQSSIATYRAATAQVASTRELEQTNIALARRLATQSQSLLDSDEEAMQIGSLLAIESALRLYTQDADIALRKSLERYPQIITKLNQDSIVVNASISPDGINMALAGGYYIDVYQIATGKEVLRIKHDDMLETVQFSPDGSKMVSGSEDHSARVWNAETGKEITRFMHTNTVDLVTFSADGQLVASVGRDNLVHVWDANTGSLIQDVIHDANATAISFNPTNLELASGDSDGKILIHEPIAHNFIAQFSLPGSITSLVYSPNGNIIGSSSSNGTIFITESDGDLLFQVTHTGVNLLCFSPRGDLLASGASDGSLRVWDLATGNQVMSMSHDDAVTDIGFSPNGYRLISGGVDKTARAWDLSTGQEIGRLRHTDTITKVAFIQDNLVFSASLDYSARVWRVGADFSTTNFRKEADVWDFSFSPDNTLFATGDKNGNVIVRNTATGDEIARIKHDDIVIGVMFTPDSKRIVTAGQDNKIHLWNALTGEILYSFEHEIGVRALDISSDGQWIVSAGYSDVHVWELVSGREISSARIDDVINKVVFSPDGRLFSTADIAGNVIIWETQFGNEIGRIGDNLLDAETLAFSADGQKIVAGGDNFVALVWDIVGDREISRMLHEDEVRMVSFSPDGEWVASSSIDGVVKVWEVATGQELIRSVHDKIVWAVAFSFDQKYFFSGSWDGKILGKDMETGQGIVSLFQGEGLEEISLNPDQKRLFSGSGYGSVFGWLWRPEDLISEVCSRLSRNLTHAEWIHYIGENIPYRATCPDLPIPTE